MLAYSYFLVDIYSILYFKSHFSSVAEGGRQTNGMLKFDWSVLSHFAQSVYPMSKIGDGLDANI